MNVLGIKLTYHDTGAALISNGKVAAIAEERLNRVKHSKGMFPKLSIQYCLDTLGVKPEEIDLVVIDQVLLKSVIKPKEIFLAWDKSSLFSKAKIEVINHHDAHAASAFFCSPFDEAAILVYDGSGETHISQFGIPAVETDAFYFGKDNQLSELRKTTHARVAGEYPYTFGIGRLYATLSSVYLNFGPYNEGKMMGLAPYGDDSLLKKFPYEKWFCERFGHIFCNSQISFPGFSKSIFKVSKYDLLNPFKDLRWKLIAIFRQTIKHLIRLAYRKNEDERQFLTDPKFFEKIFLPMPARQNESLPDKYYTSVAYLAQHVLEVVAVKLGKKLKELTRCENICVAGGVGLNIDANKNFLDKAGFKHIFIQPAASDTGVALGCALYGLHIILKQPRFWEMKSASLGMVYPEKTIISAIDQYKDKINFYKSSDIAKEAAKLIAEGKIIGWFNGGAEYGPRALGNRSILCDARIASMKDTLNYRVKHREPWRPFAASVLAEHMSEWFELEEPSPFMLLAAKVKTEKQPKIPSLVHVDGTCRIQSVTSESNKRYYDLINEFNKLTGVPLLLNTSFNLGGDPIVETPGDALDTFTRTDMDCLVLDDYLISKK